MREIAPLSDLNETQFKRVAARHRLPFHINQHDYLTEQHDYAYARVATWPEVQMWRILCPEAASMTQCVVSTLDATAEELVTCLTPPGPYTLNAHDVAVLVKIPEFTISTTRSELLLGIRGHLDGTTIYVSRLIPKGYYYIGALEMWQPPADGRALEPEIDPTLECRSSWV